MQKLHLGYTIVRTDRKICNGGVLLGLKTSTFKFVCEIEHNHDFEIAVVEVTTSSNMKMLVCSCYP